MQVLNYSQNITLEDGTHWSIGTVINSNTLLTHNHYNVPLGSLRVDGQEAVYADPIGTGVAGGDVPQTQLFTFNTDISETPANIASQHMISSIDYGSTVSVVYWDDSKSEMTVGLFTVKVPPSGGIIMLDDPIHFINPGDSGGGVFYENKLIGNLWKVIPEQDLVIAASVPPEISNSSKAITPILRK